MSTNSLDFVRSFRPNIGINIDIDTWGEGPEPRIRTVPRGVNRTILRSVTKAHFCVTNGALVIDVNRSVKSCVHSKCASSGKKLIVHTKCEQCDTSLASIFQKERTKEKTLTSTIRLLMSLTIVITMVYRGI